MSELKKTKQFIIKRIEENRSSKTGVPITDFDIEEVSKEINRIESGCRLYKLSAIILSIGLVVRFCVWLIK